MKNISHYKGDTFEFHKEVVSSKNNTKKDPAYRNRIVDLNGVIKDQFIEYDNNFKNNSLENIDKYKHTKEEKTDLLKLYSYKNSIITRLKIKITTTESNRIINTCPNCTINEINSFDHYLPKDKFPEFVVNPKNLFPSCTSCNGFKKDCWVNDKKRLFLNLYLDELPTDQFLFVDIDIIGDIVSAAFYLKNNGNINEDIFNIIETHYNKLHLLERFSTNINDIVTTLENTINSFITKVSLEEIKDTIIEKCNKDKIAFGYNYWKSILETELVNNVEYMKRFKV